MGGKSTKPVPWQSKLRFRCEDLRLRSFVIDDATEFWQLVDRNRAYLRQWMPWLDITRDVAHVQTFIAGCINDYRVGAPSLRLAICVDDAIVGIAALELIFALHGTAHIGYWLDEGHNGRGIMTRSVATLLTLGFERLGLRTIELRAAEKNRRSRAVAERLDMLYEGNLRKREWLYDHSVDLAVYSILREEWLASKHYSMGLPSS